MRHLLEIDDLTKDELFEVIALALDPNPPQVLSRKGMALVVQKPSARTRNSMEMAVKDLGGHPVTRADRALHEPEELRARFCPGPVHALVRCPQVRAVPQPVAGPEERGIAAVAVLLVHPIGHVKADRGRQVGK